MCHDYEGWFTRRRAAQSERKVEPAQPERRAPEVPAAPEPAKPAPAREPRERVPA